jgi:sulfur carrier protein
MNVTVNGKKEEYRKIMKLTELLHLMQISEEEKGFAVALNQEVVFKSNWQTTVLNDGDTVEIIRATQGG